MRAPKGNSYRRRRDPQGEKGRGLQRLPHPGRKDDQLELCLSDGIKKPLPGTEEVSYLGWLRNDVSLFKLSSTFRIDENILMWYKLLVPGKVRRRGFVDGAPPPFRGYRFEWLRQVESHA